MMRRLLCLLLMGVFLAACGLGCGGNKDKGIHNHRDRQRAPDPGER